MKLEDCIRIGFCQPSFYRRPVWREAERVMERLVALCIGVVRVDYGRGKGKYGTTQDFRLALYQDERIAYLAGKYRVAYQ